MEVGDEGLEVISLPITDAAHSGSSVVVESNSANGRPSLGINTFILVHLSL